MIWRAAVLLTLLPAAAGLVQPTVRVTDGWVKATAADAATAYVTVANGTMYDIYLVGASSEVATTVELKQIRDSAVTTAKDIAVPSFDRLQMSPDSTFLSLTGLKRALKAGESVTIVLITDGGEQLSAIATVK